MRVIEGRIGLRLIVEREGRREIWALISRDFLISRFQRYVEVGRLIKEVQKYMFSKRDYYILRFPIFVTAMPEIKGELLVT